MEWKIVHFLVDNVVEVVPSAWVFNDICYWPPYKGSKLTQAISSCTSPLLGEWEICKIRQLANGQIYDNLCKAKAKCAKAENTSDLNSEVETKRPVKRKRFFDEINSGDDVAQFYNVSISGSISSSDNSEDYDISNTALPSSPSTTNVKLQSTVSNKSVVESNAVRKYCGKKNHELPTTSAYNKSSSETVKSSEKHCDKENHELPTISYNKSSETVNASENLSDNNFKRQVLRQLQIINLRQQQFSEDLSVLLMKANSDKHEPFNHESNEDSIFKSYNFPLKEIEELELVEEFLINDNNFKKFITEIMQIGGTSYKHMVKRVLTRILSNDLSKTYSWIGFKGKRNFSNLWICSAILIATQKTHGCSEAMIEAIMKYWLVKSTERQAANEKKNRNVLHSK